MNPNPDPDPQSDWLDRASHLPRPVLRPEASQRSLAAALAALEESPALTPPRRGKLHRFINIHTVGWAACWLAIGLFQLQAPPRSPRSEAAPLAAWPAPPQDPEMARLIASLYPQRPLARTSLTANTAADFLWIPQP